GVDLMAEHRKAIGL
ncbi:hypothetical protein, partial [Aeromonas salmonicida]